VTLLASISIPGRLDLSLVSVVRIFSAGKLSSYREVAQISGVGTCLLAEVVFHSTEVLRFLRVL
jgi:alkylated DNA nucleotide flippase Atl1